MAAREDTPTSSSEGTGRISRFANPKRISSVSLSSLTSGRSMAQSERKKDSNKEKKKKPKSFLGFTMPVRLTSRRFPLFNPALSCISVPLCHLTFLSSAGR